MRKTRLVSILILLLFPAVLIGAAVSLLNYDFFTTEKNKVAAIKNTVSGSRSGQVLAELDQTIVPEFEVNINSSFSRDVSIDGGLEVQGVTIFNDGIEAPNVVYRVTAGNGISLSGQQEVLIQNNGVLSLQGQSGAVTLTPGEGITIDGTTISLDEESRNALGSQPSAGVQNAFRTLLISGQNSITASGADNLTFEAGTGIQLITDPTTKTVRIVNTNTSGGSVAAGWEDTGSAVVLSSDSDFVGIGTDSPTAALDVNGSVRFRGTLADVNNSTGSVGYVLTATSTGVEWQAPAGGVTNAFLQNGNSFGANAVLGTNDTFGLLFETNGLERIRITSAGNVGIGVTNPLSALSLPAATTGRASLSIAQGTQPVSGVTGDIYAGSGNLYFYNGSVWEDLTNYWSLNGTDIFYNGGELGLGTSSPVEKLEVYQGNIRLNTGGETDGTERKITWFDSAERWSIGFTSNDSEQALRFSSAGSNVFAIDAAGNVGIGVTSPVRTLDVNGVMRLGTTTQPTSPVSGDIYNDGSNLYYYDGLDWVELTSGTSTFWNQNGSSIYYNGGNVGVGNNAPAALFSVGSSSQFRVAANGNVSTSGTLTLSSLTAGGLLKAGVSTGTFELATAGTDYEVPVTFSNGITRTGNAITLGGTLTTDTTITTAGNDLVLAGTGNLGIQQSNPTRPLDVNGVMRLRSTTEPSPGLAGDLYFNGTTLLFYDGAGWNDLVGGGGSSLFTDSGAITYLTETTDALALGGSSSTAPFYFDATNQLLTLTNTTAGASFRVNDETSDTTPFLIAADGNVGIGTTSPTRSLTVNGAMRLLTTTTPSSGAAGDIYTDGTSLYFHNGTAFQNLSTGAALWQQNGSDIYYNTGRVGVGTNGPVSELQVEAASDPEIRLVDTGTLTSGLVANGNGLYTVTNAGSIMFRTGVNASGDWTSTGTERLRIASTGNVGIGQTNPQRLLHVGGAIRLDTTAEPLTAAAGDVYSSGTSLFFYDGTGWQDLLNGGGASIWTDSGAVSYLTQITDDLALGGSTTAAPFFFDSSAELLTLTNTTTGASFRVNDQASDTTPFIINAAGLVGIGNTNPATELDINGTLTQRGIAAPAASAASTGRIYFDSATGKFRVSEDGNAYVDLVSGASSTFNFGGNTFGALATLGTNDGFNLAFETNDTTRMTIDTSGRVGIGTTNPAQSLDVNGTVRSRSGGFMFPDGSIQTTAVGAGGGYWAANSTHIYNVNAGNVGIGVTSPSFKLDVAGGGRFTGELQLAGNISNNTQNPIMYVHDVNSSSRAVLQLSANASARNYFQMTATEGNNTTPTLATVGAWNDINLALTPKGVGNVIIGANDLLFNDTAPELLAFNATNGNHRSVLQLTADTNSRNYFNMNASTQSGLTPTLSVIGADTNLNLALTPKGTGNVIITANDLLFTDTAPELLAFNATNGNHRSVLQLTADTNSRNYFNMNASTQSGLTPTLSVIGADTNLNLALAPKGTGNVIINSNNLLFNNTAPILQAFNSTNGNHRSVLQLTADTSARNYFLMNATEGDYTTPTLSTTGPWTNINLGLAPKGAGNVIINSNDLLFNDTAPELKAYNSSNANHRSVLMLTANNSARNYFQMNATEGDFTIPTLSAVGAWSNIHLGLTAKGAGSVVLTGRSVALSTTIPGTTVGTTHIQPSTTTAGHMTSLTFGSSAAASPGTAQAGIYVEGTSTGTIMRLATADNLTSGSKVRLTIDQSGALTTGAITSGAISATGNVSATGTVSGAMVNIGGSAITNGRLQVHGTSTNVANGPHTYVTTTQDTFPVFNQLNWSHDNISMNFDAYYDGAFRSGSVGSNYQIYKVNNLLNFNYASGVAAGSGVTFQPGMVMNTSGFIGLGHTAPDARLHLADNVASGAIDNLSEYQIILYDGTATSAYGMGIEANTMWFNSGGSDYRWYAAGSQSMHLDSGNLGIGTTSAPASRLHVVGSQLRWDPSTTTTNSGILFVSGGDNYAEIRAGQVGNYNAYEPLVLNSSPTGYVGVGTTTPQATLHVGYSDTSGQRSPLARFGLGIGLTSTTDTQAWFGSSNWMWNGSAWNRTASSNAVMWGTGNNAGAFEVWTTDSTTATNTAPSNTNSRLIVLNNGNVGVGLINPTNRFEVTGNSAVNGNMIINSSGAINQTVNSWGDKWYMAGADIKVGMNQTNTAWQFDIGGTTGLTRYRLNATTVGSINGPIVDFNTSGSSIFYGNVGVGGATPSTFQLEVNGAIGPSADNVNALGSSGRRFTEVFAANGTINTSDQRLKTDIQELQYGLDEILALDTVSYAWKGGNQADRKLGLIAQNLQQIMPEVVHVGSDVNKTLGVYYTDLIPVTIKAIQEQQEQINAMKLKTDEQSIMDKIMALMQSDASQSKEINELNKRVASISAELVQANTTITQAPPVATTSVDLSKLETRTTSLEAEIASLSARLTALVLGTSTASTSALVENQTSVSDLIVSNTANINDLGVTGSITAGLLSISGMDELGGSSINTLVEPLKLQSLRGGAIEMMGGDFRIETDGTVTIAGTVEAQTVKAETVQTKVLEVDRSENENATAGTATIKPGETSVVIKTTSVKADSLIFVTEKTEQFAALIVTGQKDGESFTVKMKEAASGDVTFNWLIVK